MSIGEWQGSESGGERDQGVRSQARRIGVRGRLSGRRWLVSGMRGSVAVFALVGSLVWLSPAGAQLPLPAERASSHLEIIKGPRLEMARADLAIIRWTTNNPGGSDDHFAVAHYGTSPDALSQTAKSPIRLNRTHAQTMFRVRLDGLKARTTYYYTVSSMGSDGVSDGEQSPVHQFTTPGPGKLIINYPQPK